jgi:hypothetical protein
MGIEHELIFTDIKLRGNRYQARRAIACRRSAVAIVEARLGSGMEPDEQTARREAPDNDFPTHPEEMRAKIELRIGDRTVVMATVRTTPARIVSVGVMVSAILLSVAALVHTVRQKL